ncbi:hypothetical protein F2P79_001308 [Pimephales promelas]|nr:hypothetical protein F2P79_001308 [Pimephales promelas]
MNIAKGSAGETFRSRLQGFQRAGTHCAVRLNAGLLFWTRATVVCLRPFTQPHLPVISSPNCSSSSSVPTQDPD